MGLEQLQLVLETPLMDESTLDISIAPAKKIIHDSEIVGMDDALLTLVLADDPIDRIHQQWPPFTHPLPTTSHFGDRLNLDGPVFFGEAILDAISRNMLSVDPK